MSRLQLRLWYLINPDVLIAVEAQGSHGRHLRHGESSLFREISAEQV